MAEEKKADDKKNTWVQWVALTTTILAVCAAISSLKGGGYSTKVQLSTTVESNKWAYYQAKSIKQHLSEMEARQLEVIFASTTTADARQAAEARVAAARAEARRYEGEKAAIKAEAEGLQKDETENKRHGAAFGQAVMLLQIAITLSSVGALIKKPVMWYVGLAFGAAGLLYMANGFLLFF